MQTGETLTEAAIRETKEEAGISVSIRGILHIDYITDVGSVRFRVVFFATPLDESELPKPSPDYESVGASWIHVGFAGAWGVNVD